MKHPKPSTLDDVFPFEYKGGGYFRRKGIPKGVTAEILHGQQAIEYLYSELTKHGVSEPNVDSSHGEHQTVKNTSNKLRAEGSSPAHCSPPIQHTATPFEDNGSYRGWSCDCGYTASSGDYARDEAEIVAHIRNETGFAWPTRLPVNEKDQAQPDNQNQPSKT